MIQLTPSLRSFKCCFNAFLKPLCMKWKIDKRIEAIVKNEICWYPSMSSSSYGILDIRPGCARTMIIVPSRQAGPEKMPEHIGGLSLKGGRTAVQRHQVRCSSLSAESPRRSRTNLAEMGAVTSRLNAWPKRHKSQVQVVVRKVSHWPLLGCMACRRETRNFIL